MNGVGQAAHQVVAQVAAGGAVRLIHQDHNGLAGVQVGGDVVELMDHGDDQPTEILIKKVLELRASVRICDLDLFSLDLAEESMNRVRTSNAAPMFGQDPSTADAARPPLRINL